MLNPEKLLASATRIYGDRMDSAVGRVPAGPEDKLVVAQDEEKIDIGNLRIIPINTPGHAEHHYAYLFEDICFCGDVGGVRIPGYQYLRVPMPPPELHLERWHESINRLRQEFKFNTIAPYTFWYVRRCSLAFERSGQRVGTVPHAGWRKSCPPIPLSMRCVRNIPSG